MNTKAPRTYQYANYCASFLDVLGQQAALKDEGLLRQFADPVELDAYLKGLTGKVRPIARLQDRADKMLKTMLDTRSSDPRRSVLSENEKRLWNEMMFTKMSKQHWSDGLVSFVSLGDQNVKCVMNGVFGVISLAGTLCLLGLADKQPIRGAIEIAWGIEIQPGELYGAVIARSYELESSVAQYPRIVVGKETVKFLAALGNGIATDDHSRVNKTLAQLCMGLIIEDVDGHHIVHYLGEEFQNAVSSATHEPLYKLAREFVEGEYQRFKSIADSKHSFRYATLLAYFSSFPPSPEATN